MRAVADGVGGRGQVLAAVVAGAGCSPLGTRSTASITLSIAWMLYLHDCQSNQGQQQRRSCLCPMPSMRAHSVDAQGARHAALVCAPAGAWRRAGAASLRRDLDQTRQCRVQLAGRERLRELAIGRHLRR